MENVPGTRARHNRSRPESCQSTASGQARKEQSLEDKVSHGSAYCLNVIPAPALTDASKVIPGCQIAKARLKEIAKFEKRNQAMDQVHKKISEGNSLHPTRGKRIHNAETSVFAISRCVGDYLMIHTHSNMEHKLEPKRSGPM